MKRRLKPKSAIRTGTSKNTKLRPELCIKCGSKPLPNAKFCHRCGTPLPRRASPPYRSPIAETYYETVFKPIAEEKLGEKIRHRASPIKPFEK